MAVPEKRQRQPRRPQRPRPVNALQEGGGAAEALPQRAGGVVRFVTDRDVLRAVEEGARELNRHVGSPARGVDDQLRADRRLERLAIHRHPARHHTEEPDDLSVVVFVHERRERLVSRRVVEKHSREVAVRWGPACAITRIGLDDRLVQTHDLRDVGLDERADPVHSAQHRDDCVPGCARFTPGSTREDDPVEARARRRDRGGRRTTPTPARTAPPSRPRRR